MKAIPNTQAGWWWRGSGLGGEWDHTEHGASTALLGHNWAWRPACMGLSPDPATDSRLDPRQVTQPSCASVAPSLT